LLPFDKEGPEEIFLPSQSHTIIGTGEMKNAVIYIPDIGKFVAEIIHDERTLNNYVFCWTEEKSQNEIWAIARKAKLDVTGEPLKATVRYKSIEQVMEDRERAADGSFEQLGEDYLLSFFIRGDNTVENAKKAEYGGALDARELYPHLKLTTVEEAAKLMYENK